MLFPNTPNRSNRSIFVHEDSGSPHDALVSHISGLGQIARLDFERCAVAGEVIFAIEGDATPVSQQEEEARIGTLAYALHKLGNNVDAAEFTRCLNAICEDGDALGRQTVARHYYNEITARGANEVLKEMGLLAMQLASLTAPMEEIETEFEMSTDTVESWPEASRGQSIQKFFAEEIETIRRMTGGRRRSACFVHDEATEWLNDLEASGASLEDLDAAFAHVDAMEQYDEGGAVIAMSSHDRTIACGRLDSEFSADDLPERARHLATELRRGYVNGTELDSLWEDINAQIDILYPVSGKTADGKRFFSHANREIQQFIRQCLEALLDECRQDFHLMAMRNSPLYRRFYGEIRKAADTRKVGETMKQAYEARQAGSLSVKHLVALKTAATLQRERLQSLPLSIEAQRLIREIEGASEAKVRFLSWALYGKNQPAHPVHSLPAQMQAAVWAALNARKERISLRRRAA